MTDSPGFVLAIMASGTFLLTGLVTGVWKYLQIRKSPDAQAHVYVDIAHRASLLYSFAALVIAKFVELSVFSDTTNLVAATFPVVFFAIAIGTYIVHAVLDDTDNQFRDPNMLTTVGMWALIVSEIGGFAVLFVGVALRFFG